MKGPLTKEELRELYRKDLLSEGLWIQDRINADGERESYLVNGKEAAEYVGKETDIKPEVAEAVMERLRHP